MPLARQESEILTFLIVEDEPINRRLLSTIIRHLGHQPLEAEGGREALSLLETPLSLDVVLLDLHMAHVDGFALLAHLRSRAETQALPVVCISAQARPEDRQKARLAGANGYVVKPFRRRDLIAAIDAVLQETGRLAPGASIAPS